MWFKNLQPYRLPVGWAIALPDLTAQLARKTFQPCGSQDLETRGWSAPCAGGELVHAVGGHWLVCLETEAKLLPTSVVKQEADRRAAEIAEEQGYKLGRKAMKELREEIAREMLPRAFTRRRKTYAWIDQLAGWLVVDAASSARAEDLLEVLRDSLENFPLALLRTERSPASAMAEWLAAGETPEGFTVDGDCHLCSIAEDRREVAYRRGLDDEQIREHLAAGKLPTRLAMTFDDRLSFVLTEKMEVKRLDFLDVVKDQVGDQAEDAAAVFDAEFTLMAGELGRLLPAIVDALGGELETPQ